MSNSIKGSKILITGGAGFIGSYVVEELLKHNPRKIIILDNLSRGSLNNIKDFISHQIIEFIHGDIRDTELLEDCIKGVDFVFHMAALRINACAANPKYGFDVMLKSTFDIAELCVKHNIKKVIYSSSASVYGLADDFPTPETNHPYQNQTFYGGAKLWGEQLFRSYKYMFGLDYIALRYFNVYGPGMDTEGKYTEVMIRWLDCIRTGEPPLIYGDGTSTMDFINVRDVATANVSALLSEVTDEVFNIGNNEETSLQQLLELLLEVNNSRLIPQLREANTINPVQRRLADNRKAIKVLGFKPAVDLKAGLLELSQWYFDKDSIKNFT